MSSRFIFIGAGNLATRLSLEFKRKGFLIDQVFSRTDSSAKALAAQLNCDYTIKPELIHTGTDIIYIVALKDSAVHQVLPHIHLNNNLVVHCSGSLSLAELDKYSENTGVFYPLQTFSKLRHVDFSPIPVFIESGKKANENKLMEIASKITDKVMIIDSHKRLKLHIAAIFACNFVNHFYTLADDILKSHQISFDVLHQLINETAMKVQEIEPAKAQTGPAVRYDTQIISAHLEALQDFPELKELYHNITNSIYLYYKKSNHVIF
jgi:predicted short-subunit dehydrogenase-like oxidoreductase (DUF2520 family)